MGLGLKGFRVEGVVLTNLKFRANIIGLKILG